MLKWILRIAAFIIFLLAAVVLYVELNKDKLVRKAVDKIEENLTVQLDYADSDISLLKTFPHVGLTLSDIVISDSTYNEAPLVALGKFTAALNAMDAIRNSDNPEIEKIIFKDGTIHVINRKDGTNNYTVVKESDESETAGSSDLSVNINSYELEDIKLIYSDLSTGDQYQLAGLDAEGVLAYKSGAIEMTTDLSSEVVVDLLNTPMDLMIKGLININESYDAFSVADGEVKINDLPIMLNADAQVGETTDYDVSFSSPATTVRQLFSLLPQVYRNQYADVVTQGTFKLAGELSGNTAAAYPKYSIDLAVSDAQLRYPDLDQSIDDLSFALQAKNNSNSTMYSTVDVDGLKVKVGSSYLNGDVSAVSLRNGNDVKLDLDGDINLKDIYDAFHWDGVEELSGQMAVQLKTETTIDDKSQRIDIGAGEFESVLDLQNFKYVNSETGTISIAAITANGDNRELRYTVEDFYYPGVNDLDLEGTVADPLSAIQPDVDITGTINVTIAQIDMPTMAAQATLDSTAIAPQYVIPSIKINSYAEIAEIIYPPYEISGIAVEGLIGDDQSTLDFAIGSINGNKIVGDASFENVLQYGLNNDTLRGDLIVRSEEFVLDSFLETEEAAATTTKSTESMIPGNLAVNVDYNADKVTFKTIDLAKALGEISIKDQAVQITNSANVFGGDVAFTGTFDEGTGGRPVIDLSIDVSNLGFSETVKDLFFFTDLIPFAEYLEGRYAGTLQWKSELTEEFWPDLNTLSSFGEIETMGSGFKSFVPVDSVLSFLGNKLPKRDWKIEDTKRYFLVEDGKVIVKKMSLQREDIKLTYSGSHSFKQEIDYDMTLSIPKNKVNIDKVYDLVTKTLSLPNELRSLADDVNLDLVLKVGGSLTKPTIKIQDVQLRRGDVVESIKESAVAKAEETKEKVETKVRDTIDYVKTTVQDTIEAIKDEAQSRIDSVKSTVNTAVDQEKKELEEKATGILDSLKAGNTDSLSTQLDDLFGDQKEKIDKLKDKIKIDIFKKKKDN